MEVLEKKNDIFQMIRTAISVARPVPLKLRFRVNREDLSDAYLINFQVYKGKVYLSEEGEKRVNNVIWLREDYSSVHCISEWDLALVLFSRLEKKEVEITTWEVADNLGVLGTYFGIEDHLYIAKDVQPVKDSYKFYYGNDYEKWLTTVPKNEKIEAYYQRLKINTREIEMSEISYNLQVSDTFYYSHNQTTEYADIIDQFESVAIASDGLGVASYYCHKNGKDYISWELNEIGRRARLIGLIHGKDPIYDSDRVYLFFFCHTYYSLPMFPGQKYVIIDLPENLPKYPLERYSGVSSTMKIRLKNIKIRSPAFVCSRYYPLDELSKDIMSKVGAKEVRDFFDAQFIVFSKISSIQVAIRSTLYTIPYLTEYIKVTKKNITPKLLLEKNRNKTVYLPRKNFPFRESVKLGDMKIDNGFVYWHYGVGSHYTSNGYFRGTNEISNASVVRDYTVCQGYVVIRHSRPEIVRSVMLKEEHRAMADSKIAPVLMINVKIIDKIKYGYYIFASLANYSMPNIDVILEQGDNG